MEVILVSSIHIILSQQTKPSRMVLLHAYRLVNEAAFLFSLKAKLRIFLTFHSPMWYPVAFITFSCCLNIFQIANLT